MDNTDYTGNLDMVIVTSAEFQKNYGRYKDTALREPVSITSHGRESLVVLSADEYKRLKALDERRALHPSELPGDLHEALMDAKAPEWTSRFNDEME